EEEAARHKVEFQPAGNQKRYSLDKILIKVIENYKLQLNDQLKSRIRSAIFNFLRDRRTLVDTEAVLKRPASESGLGLEEPIVSNLSNFLREIKQKINRESGLVIDEKNEADEAKVKYVPPKEPVKTVESETAKPLPLKVEAENLKLKEDLERKT
ncbi:hypothetical protein COV21_00875, partial [Candidatus Woesearchaeota archaeon CG10_big_fil_rev_8_21_14_0_10_45_5]